jgi:hypothetical protein
MNKLEVIKFLLTKIEKEQDKLKRYNKAEKEAEERANKDDEHSSWYYIQWEESQPSKAKIQDYFKIIRRLTLEIEKGDDD